MRSAGFGCGLVILVSALTAPVLAATADARLDTDTARGAYHALDVVEPGLALEDLDKAIAADPYNAKAYRLRGFVRYALGQNIRALADFDKAIQMNPGDAQTRMQRAEALFISRQLRRSFAEYGNAASANPEFAESAAAMTKFAGNAAALFGNDLPTKTDAGDFVGYGHDIQPLIRVCDDPEAEGNITPAEARLLCGRFMLALALYCQRAIGFDLATDDTAADADSAAYLRHKKVAEEYNWKARANIDRAIVLAPQSAEAWFYRAQIGVDGQPDDERLGHLNRAIKLKPDYADAYFERALYYSMKGNKVAARADAAKAAELLKR